MANDAAFAEAARAILEDPGVDCAVFSPLPMTGALQTLPPGSVHKENIFDPSSIGQRLIALSKSSDKPFIVNLDAGLAYDPLTTQLEEAGIPVFRDCDAAVKFLRGGGGGGPYKN